MAAPELPAPQAWPEAPSLLTSPPRILVVDDEECIRDGVEQVLRRKGFEVVTACDGKEALAVLAREPFHLALLDLRMPEMDGLEVLTAINRAGLDLDVVIVTAHGTIETAVEAIKMGAADFLTKPFVPWQLRQVVERAVAHRRLKEEHDLLAAEREKGLWAITTEKSRLKTVINSMSEGVLICGEEHSIVMCNPALTSLLEVKETCLIGAELSHRPELAPLARMAGLLLTGGHDLRVITQEIVTPGHSPRHLRANANKILSEEQQTLGLVFVVEDITIMKEMEQKKADFINMVTHELRAPLGVVDTQLRVILRGLAGELSDKQAELFGRMGERVTALLEMINNLLDLAKMDNQCFVQQKCEVDLNAVVSEGCRLMELQARGKDLEMRLELSTTLPLVVADPLSLKEVVVNLVSNSIRYTPAGGQLTIRSGADAGYAWFEVSDNGLGIAQEDQDRIFERFYRVKNDSTRHIAGTGLGLPIVKAIVDDHHGHVTVKSQTGRGSTFRVSLPRPV
ncbi:MAG: response regulator [Deltaproteobacteria bacterium]|nr:response regulator [Deltaproteobacteria bacterium]